MPFIQNKYYRWYYQIINSASNRNNIEGGEIHHILPKSLGGSDHKENMVRLSSREHFICHWLLPKMTCGRSQFKMLYALNGMKRESNNHSRYTTKITSRVYEKLRIAINSMISAHAKGKAPAIELSSGKKLGKIPVDDPRWETGEIVGTTRGKTWSAGKAAAIDSASGFRLGSVSTDDPRWKTGEIVSPMLGRNMTTEHRQNISKTRKTKLAAGDFEVWNKGQKVGPNGLAGTASAKDAVTGQMLGRVSVTDPRWKSGLIVGPRKKIPGSSSIS